MRNSIDVVAAIIADREKRVELLRNALARTSPDTQLEKDLQGALMNAHALVSAAKNDYGDNWPRHDLKWATNSKLEKTGTVSLGLPAGQSKDGFVVCKYAGACQEKCFAANGFFRSRAWRRLEFNLEVYRVLGAEKFTELGIDYVRRTKFSAIRFHDSGDFMDESHLLSCYRIGQAALDVGKKVYAYTKALALPSLWTKRPEGFIVVQSAGGTLDESIDFTKPHALVFNSVEEMEDADYVNCSKSDGPVLGGAVKIGLKYHGQRKRGLVPDIVKASRAVLERARGGVAA